MERRRRSVFFLQELFFFALFFLGGSFFNDPFYPDSWYLHNIDYQPQVSINALPAWELATGKGITIGFGQHAPFYLNAELVDRLNQSATSSNEPPNYVQTGVISTAVGNADNNFCSVGVAYEASYAILGNKKDAYDLDFLDFSPMVDIYVIDFSGSDRSNFHMACSGCWEKTQKVAEQGGVVISRAGGGGESDNCNYDQYVNSPNQLIVGAHTEVATPFQFTEPCSAVLFSAPGGSAQKGLWVGTDHHDSVSNCQELSGTQLAVGIAAGAVALVKEVTHNKLSSRDIAHILVQTARPFPDSVKNAANLSFHERLGFGMLDVGEAVRLARKAAHHPFIIPQNNIIWNIPTPHTIPEMGELSVKATIITEENVLVDYVVVKSDINHSYAGDLSISLTSPAGTISNLSLPRIQSVSDNQKMGIFHSIGKTLPMVALNDAISIPNGKEILEYENVVFYEIQGFCCSSSQRCSTSIKKENEGNYFYILLLRRGPCAYYQQLENIFARSPHYVLPQMVLVEADMEVEFSLINQVIRDVPVLSLSINDFYQVEGGAHSSLEHPVSVAFLQKYEKDFLSFNNWAFTTTKNWNEQASEKLIGRWTITIKDHFPEDSGVLNSLSLQLHTFVLSSNKNQHS